MPPGKLCDSYHHVHSPGPCPSRFSHGLASWCLLVVFSCFIPSRAGAKRQRARQQMILRSPAGCEDFACAYYLLRDPGVFRHCVAEIPYSMRFFDCTLNSIMFVRPAAGYSSSGSVECRSAHTTFQCVRPMFFGQTSSMQ